MLKLCGCVLLVLCGWGIGAYLTARDQRRILTGEAMLDLVRFVRAQMSSFCRPREELFGRYEHPLLEESGFLAYLRESGSISVALKGTNAAVDAEVLQWMCDFDRELGRTYLEGQLSLCDYYKERLESHLAVRREAHPSRTRVWRTVALAAAMLAALLLL